MAENKKNGCVCEHDDCDCGCHEDDIVVLVDEEGKEVSFYHVATLDHDGKEYACLQEAENEDPVIEIFELEEAEEDGEEIYNFLPVDDETYEILFAQLQKEVEELTHEDCHDEHCDCGCHHEE